jgi:hypothetical protein
MQKLIYRGHEILDNVKSYNLYGDNDKLIRIFKKDEAKLDDVFRHVDKLIWKPNEEALKRVQIKKG